MHACIQSPFLVAAWASNVGPDSPLLRGQMSMPGIVLKKAKDTGAEYLSWLNYCSPTSVLALKIPWHEGVSHLQFLWLPTFRLALEVVSELRFDLQNLEDEAFQDKKKDKHYHCLCLWTKLLLKAQKQIMFFFFNDQLAILPIVGKAV